MNRERAEQLLNQGETLSVLSWTFTKQSWWCHAGCCDGENSDIEEALDLIDFYCDGDWEEVKLD